MSEALEDELKQRATHLGMSVSNLVRNILQHTVGLVEELKDGARQTTAWVARFHAPEVLAWHEVVMNVNAVCDGCNGILQRGSRAALAVTSGLGSRQALCLECLDKLDSNAMFREVEAPGTAEKASDVGEVISKQQQ